MKRAASPLSCFCGEAAGAAHCTLCRHPACDACVIGAGGVVRQCPGCSDGFVQKDQRPCHKCTIARASTWCNTCVKEFCSTCVTHHGCNQVCRGCGSKYRLEECRGCNVAFCQDHLSSHVRTFCSQMAKCKNAHCGARLVIGTEGLLCSEPGCYEVWCPACCYPVTAPPNRGVCWEHLLRHTQCNCCNLRTVGWFITDFGGGVRCCGNCLPRAREVYMSLRFRTPLLPELAKKIALLAIARGAVAWTGH